MEKSILFIVCIFIVAIAYLFQVQSSTYFDTFKPRKQRARAVRFSDKVDQRLFSAKTGKFMDSVVIINDKK